MEPGGWSGCTHEGLLFAFFSGRWSTVRQAATSGIMIVLVQAVLLLWAQCERHSGRNLCSLYSVTLQVELGLACRLSMGSAARSLTSRAATGAR